MHSHEYVTGDVLNYRNQMARKPNHLEIVLSMINTLELDEDLWIK